MKIDWKWMLAHVALLAVLGCLLRFVPQVPAPACVAAILAVLGMMSPSMVFRPSPGYVGEAPQVADEKHQPREIGR